MRESFVSTLALSFRLFVSLSASHYTKTLLLFFLLFSYSFFTTIEMMWCVFCNHSSRHTYQSWQDWSDNQFLTRKEHKVCLLPWGTLSLIERYIFLLCVCMGEGVSWCARAMTMIRWWSKLVTWVERKGDSEERKRWSQTLPQQGCEMRWHEMRSGEKKGVNDASLRCNLQWDGMQCSFDGGSRGARSSGEQRKESIRRH